MGDVKDQGSTGPLQITASQLSALDIVVVEMLDREFKIHKNEVQKSMWSVGGNYSHVGKNDGSTDEKHGKEIDIWGKNQNRNFISKKIKFITM